MYKSSGSGTRHQEDVKENADMSSVKKCVGWGNLPPNHFDLNFSVFIVKIDCDELT